MDSASATMNQKWSVVLITSKKLIEY